MPERIGGWVICRPKPIPYWNGSTQGFTLMSDLHIGAPHVDYDLIVQDLETAKLHNDRILINGDLLDLILTSDKKRFSPEALHSRLQGAPDIVNAAIDWAVEILAPYAELIDMIGIGNHETAITRHHSVDVTRVLIRELARSLPKNSKHVIHYGGYGGFVDYRFLAKTKNRGHGQADGNGSFTGHGKRWVIHYYHGSGASAPVTKGMIDLHRRSWAHADLIWLGHKHNRFNVAVQVLSCPLQGHQPTIKDVRQVMTGAYFNTYAGQQQNEIASHGRRSNYAADLGLAPQGMGGTRIQLQFDGSTNASHNPYKVSVIQ